jgi:hypothetical protein
MCNEIHCYVLIIGLILLYMYKKESQIIYKRKN